MQITVALLSAVITVAASQPHHHAHQHAHDKRNPDPTVVIVPGPTEIAYVLNGHAISREEVEEGIRNGTLKYTNGEGLESVSSSSVASTSSYVPSSSSSVYVASSSSYSEPASTSSTSSYYPEPSSSSAASTSSAYYSSAATSYSAVASSSATSSYSAASSSSSSNGSGTDTTFDSDYTTGVDTEFPDGELSCSTFPSAYGAVAVDWIGLGGWTGIQSPGSESSSGFSDIETIDSSTCSSGSDCCGEGMYCSYACPAGYQKSQWPSTQGSTGQSVGGLLCKDGKLTLTNTDLSKNLCMTGSSAVTVLVENNLSENVAICRTDYPGTESETVPLNTQPGTTSNLTCPDADNYYNWEGGHTSAQYYVNPSGVSVSDACQWGSSANPWGNFAPLNLGVGYSSGAAWLAIFQNSPTTDATLDFTVEITGDGISGNCRYSNGQYCSGSDYSDCSSTTGCTVSISSGTATFVFSDS